MKEEIQQEQSLNNNENFDSYQKVLLLFNLERHEDTGLNF
jgi:hypothetical protein